MIGFSLIVRAAHTIAAAAWVGGNIMYLVAVIPALRVASPSPEVAAIAGQIAALFRRMVNICMGVLLLTGGYLLFDRLTQTTVGLSYVIVLVLKVAAAIAMFVLALYLGQSNIRRLAKRSTRLSRAAPQLMLALGILVFVLGALLNTLFEASIAPH
ncbi:MAG TPA: hypothetical protein VNG51_25685 [Ktedonobacteraceae bacterium]|nr:hypothetical protein [Ktedonobacteraceae bacterium]